MNVEIEGDVVRKLVGAGTKSEHMAVVLVTTDGRELTLRRLGGNAFQDPELESLIGHKIKGAGEIIAGATFLMKTYAVATG